MHFTVQPAPAAIKIVKEFCANAKDAQGNFVMVRGKLVIIDRKAINAYYGLQKIHGNRYMKYLNQDLDYSEVVEALCEPKTE